MLAEEETGRALPPRVTSRADAFRYRITFAKTSEMRYTGHLDVQRAWDRLLRRAHAPLLFTQGFHARARFSLASALPLGFTGEGELAEIYLVEDVAPDDLHRRVAASAPPGIRIEKVARIEPLAPAVQTLIDAAVYRVEVPSALDTAEVQGRVDRLLAAETLPVERRGKGYDLRPLISAIGVQAGSPPLVLAMTLVSRQGATGRPDEVLRALELDATAALVTRQRLVLRDA